MGARTTLNGIYLSGALAIAAVLGWATGSWGVFIIGLGILIGANIHAGKIRPGRRGRGSRRSLHMDQSNPTKWSLLRRGKRHANRRSEQSAADGRTG